MSSKYSVSQTERWRLEDDRPLLAQHVTGRCVDEPGRWDERTPAGAVAPETAWERGHEIDDRMLGWLAPTDRDPPTRARLYASVDDGERWGIIMPVLGTGMPTVPTVLRVESQNDPAVRSYLWTRAAWHFEEVER